MAEKKIDFKAFVEKVKATGGSTGLMGLCYTALDEARKGNTGMVVERRFLTKFLLEVPEIQKHFAGMKDLDSSDQYRRLNLYIGSWIKGRKVEITRKEKQGKVMAVKEIKF